MLIFKFFQCPYRTYRYNANDINHNFAISAIEHKTDCYAMTARGSQIQPGDFIEIRQPDQYATFQVDAIEYYSNPSDMWVAVIHRLPSVLL